MTPQTIDTFGRRNLLLFTFPNMAWTLLAAGFAFYIPNQTARTPVIVFFVFLFAGMLPTAYLPDRISSYVSFLLPWRGPCAVHLLSRGVPLDPQRDRNVCLALFETLTLLMATA